MTETEAALQMLFKEGEQTCFGFNAYDTKVYDVTDVFSWKKLPEYMSVNPLKNRRLDENVLAYRNILIECDTLGLEEQIRYMGQIGLPYATSIFSGGKSIHWMISVEDEFESEEVYRSYAERVFKAVIHADPKNKNPSRLSRFPGAIRKDKNKKQAVLSIGRKITRNELELWLIGHGSYPSPKIERPPPVELLPGQELEPSPRTRNLLLLGALKGERNSELFIAAKDLQSKGYNFDRAYEILSSAPTGLSDREILTTIKSAYKSKR